MGRPRNTGEFCRRGHRRTEENTYVQYCCRECAFERVAELRANKKSKATPPAKAAGVGNAQRDWEDFFAGLANDESVAAHVLLAPRRIRSGRASLADLIEAVA
jgi:hypothetical protein